MSTPHHPVVPIAPAERRALAAQMALNEQYLYQCFSGRSPVPPEHCPTIEFKTSGRVTVREMRPDLSWYRRPDPQWPHPEGRPCLDFVGEGATAVTGAQEAA